VSEFGLHRFRERFDNQSLADTTTLNAMKNFIDVEKIKIPLQA
jgi:hypothetical protein